MYVFFDKVIVIVCFSPSDWENNGFP